MIAPVLHQLGHVTALNESLQPGDEGYVEEVPLGNGVSARVETVETGFVAFRTPVKILVGSSVADVGVNAAVVSYWLNSGKILSTGME